MSERSAIAARILLLVLLAAGGLVTALHAWSSVTHYHTPYEFHADLPPGPPLTSRLLLIILDGVRVDASENMPFLQELARRGSAGIIRTGQPSLSNPSRAVMVTGAWQQVNGVTTNSRFVPPPVDSLLSIARKVGVPVAIAGSYFWKEAFGDYLDPQRTRLHEKRLQSGASAQELIAWQQQTNRDDLAFLGRYSSGLLIGEITAPDSAAHDYGGLSTQYRQVVAAADGCIRSFVERFDDGQTTFVVTSDHGHIDFRGHGGHGGAEQEVINVPLVFAGASIAAGHGWNAEQIDIAPTICALLGLPLPATNQGRVLWEVLQAPADIEASIRAREAGQRAFAASRFPDVEQIRRDEKRTRSLRALAVFTCFWFVGCAMALNYRQRWHWLLVAVGVYYAFYYALFFTFGLRYSLSAVNREEYLLQFFSKDLAAAAVALGVATLFLLRRHRNPGSLLPLDFGLLVGCTLALQATWIYYEHGLIMERTMLDLPSAFKAYLDLLQLAAIGVVAPGIALLQWLVAGKSRTAPAAHTAGLAEVEERVAAGDDGRF